MLHKYTFIFIAWLLVAFGQPATLPFFGILTSFLGFALLWIALLDTPSKVRFWIGFGWFFTIQLYQLSWLLSHPYFYIYAVWLIFSAALGVQFGALCLFLDRSTTKIKTYLTMAAFWTFMEWVRLFVLSGFTWNPVGLFLAAHPFSLQIASLVGVFGLSFWVIFVNGLGVRAFLLKTTGPILLWLGAGALPFILGAFIWHQRDVNPSQDKLSVVLLQPQFPVEEALFFKSHEEHLSYVVKEWETLLKLAKKNGYPPLNLLVFPECVVPYGTYSFVYPLETIRTLFRETLGETSLQFLPPLKLPLAAQNEAQWYVNNAFIVQGLANFLQSNIVIGLEDAEDVVGGERQYYSSALYFSPGSDFRVQRYAKRVLVPMGEYIPFEFCRKLAARYGIAGSFTPGKHAVLWSCEKLPFGVSICYEETFGNLMRENREKGARFLLNLTSDAWFPLSKLPLQHYEHAKLRAVENGIPLFRACNTGVTAAVDPLGRERAALPEIETGALRVEMPLQHFQTFYAHFGEIPLLLACSFLLALGLLEMVSLPILIPNLEKK